MNVFIPRALRLYQLFAVLSCSQLGIIAPRRVFLFRVRLPRRLFSPLNILSAVFCAHLEDDILVFYPEWPYAAL